MKLYNYFISFLLLMISCNNDNKQLPNDLVLIDSLLYDIQSRFDILDYIIPANNDEEKEKFFTNWQQGIIYNPTFIYNQINDLLTDTLLNKLKKIDTASVLHPLSLLLNQKRRELELQLQLIRSIGNDDSFTKLNLELYRQPSIKLFEYAIKCIDSININNKVDSSVSTQDAVNFFEYLLAKYDLQDWGVEVTNRISSVANINNNKRLIQLNENALFTTSILKRLEAHEIGVHVLRNENGKKIHLDY